MARRFCRAKVVSITAIEFNDKSIEFEIDHGGTKKKNILSNIQVNVGGASSSDQKKETPEAKGSRITLLFPRQGASGYDARNLKNLLEPVLDFYEAEYPENRHRRPSPGVPGSRKGQGSPYWDGFEHGPAGVGPAQQEAP